MRRLVLGSWRLGVLATASAGGHVANRDILAIGASAGGLQAFKKVVAGLPPDLPAAILFVIHTRGDFRSVLPEIIERAGRLPVTFAEDGQPFQHGRIYVAPPDRHLLVDENVLHLSVGARENNTRPAIDPLFRSAAVCCGSRTIGVVLTGYLDDGSSGLRAIKRCGGITVVQDPGDAAYPDMPRSALAKVTVDHVVSLADMPGLLVDLVQEPAGPPVSVPEDIQLEDAIARGMSGMEVLEHLGKRAVY